MRLFERWLEDDLRPPEVLEVSGPGGIGKSTLLSAIRRLAQARAAAGHPSGLVGLVGGGDPEAVASRLNQDHPLLLDTFEDAGGFQQVLAEELLPASTPPSKSSSPVAVGFATCGGRSGPAGCGSVRWR